MASRCIKSIWFTTCFHMSCRFHDVWSASLILWTHRTFQYSSFELRAPFPIIHRPKYMTLVISHNVFYHLCISNVEEAASFFTIFIAPRDLSSLRWHEFAQNFQHRGYSCCFYHSTKRKTIRQAFLTSFSAWFLLEHTKNRSWLVAFSSDATWYHAWFPGWSEFQGRGAKYTNVVWFAHEAHVSLTSLLEIPSEIKHPFARSVQIAWVLTPRLAESVQLLYVLFGQDIWSFLGSSSNQRNRRWTNCKSAKPCQTSGPWTAEPAGVLNGPWGKPGRAGLTKSRGFTYICFFKRPTVTHDPGPQKNP